MFLQRREDTKISLHPAGVVIADEALNHLGQLMLAGKAPALVAFPLQNAPEALHGAVVDAFANTGHTLGHPGLL